MSEIRQVVTEVADDPVQAGREALRRHAWREAFDLLQAAQATHPLPAADLEKLGEAAWWSGRLEDAIEAAQAAYAAHLDGGNKPRAAFAALKLSQWNQFKAAFAISSGWFVRAQRLLDGEPATVEHGYLAWFRAQAAHSGGDLDAALEYARQALELATRFGDRDLQAFALQDQGRILISKREVSQGLGLIDEAMVGAISGELGPFATGYIYCQTITVCTDLSDYRRAADWTEATSRWCEREAIAGFPGICRVHRAEIIRLRGAWAEAEKEARQAVEELRHYGGRISSEGLYEIGEIRLRMGDLPAAEDAFRQAHEMGRSPHPGLALVWLTEGKIEAAAAAIRRAVAEATMDRLQRAKLLPAQVEIALAAGDLEAAADAVAELEATRQVYGSPVLEASASQARGALLLAQGEAGEACQALRHAWKLWREADLPYEAAQARLLLGRAYLADGEREAGELEVRAAQAGFERLGAGLDARRVTHLVEELKGAPDERPAQAQVRRTFMFTDIVGSTSLLEAIGDEAWADIRRWHDETLRTCFTEHGGEEIDHVGDGFFVAFEGAKPALECAVAIQRTLADHRRQHGFSPQVRVGLHHAEAAFGDGEYMGKGVHEAARIGALAGGGEILASLETLPAEGAYAASEPRSMALKGIAQPVEVVSVEWR